MRADIDAQPADIRAFPDAVGRMGAVPIIQEMLMRQAAAQLAQHADAAQPGIKDADRPDILILRCTLSGRYFIQQRAYSGKDRFMQRLMIRIRKRMICARHPQT